MNHRQPCSCTRCRLPLVACVSHTLLQRIPPSLLPYPPPGLMSSLRLRPPPAGLRAVVGRSNLRAAGRQADAGKGVRRVPACRQAGSASVATSSLHVGRALPAPWPPHPHPPPTRVGLPCGKAQATAEEHQGRGAGRAAAGGCTAAAGGGQNGGGGGGSCRRHCGVFGICHGSSCWRTRSKAHRCSMVLLLLAGARRGRFLALHGEAEGVGGSCHVGRNGGKRGT